MRVELVTDDGALPGLEETWTCLLSQTPGATGFQSLAWALACHGRAATAGVKGATFDASGCEAAVAGRFDAANAGLKGCGACTTESAAVVRMIRTQIDDDHAIFCAE